LVVVRDEPGRAAIAALAALLDSVTDCPGVGLEASVVEARAAAAPAEPWPFVVHVSTAPEDRKIVWGEEHGGDRDLILHYAIVREFGWAALGSDPIEVFGSVPRQVILGQLGEELRWAVEHATGSYAVLNACRALRYRDEQVLCSKTEAAEWALARQIAPSLVAAALEERRLALRTPVGRNAAKWVTGVSQNLSR
jgi:streptomycin 3"-adenylyltransferase